jgi:anti-sigma factor RsiW
MTCDVTYEELAAFVAGDASPDRAQWLGEHVRHCATCQAKSAAVAGIDSALHKLPRLQPTTQTVLKVRRAVSRGIPAREPEVMTLQEVADFLRISLEDLYEAVDDLPAFELAGRILVRRERLIEWIDKREQAYRRQTVQSEIARGLAGSS